MSIYPSIPEIQNFLNLTLKILGEDEMTMMLHNYRSRRFHKTSNGINPSSGFRDMASTKSGPSAASFEKLWAMGKPIWGQMGKSLWQCTTTSLDKSNVFRDLHSAKSGPNSCQIWQVFGPWASPYGANGQMNMTVHSYKPRQFHRTWNGENPPQRLRIINRDIWFPQIWQPPTRPDCDDNTPTARRAEGWKNSYLLLTKCLMQVHVPLVLWDPIPSMSGWHKIRMLFWDHLSHSPPPPLPPLPLWEAQPAVNPIQLSGILG